MAGAVASEMPGSVSVEKNGKLDSTTPGGRGEPLLGWRKHRKRKEMGHPWKQTGRRFSLPIPAPAPSTGSRDPITRDYPGTSWLCTCGAVPAPVSQNRVFRRMGVGLRPKNFIAGPWLHC